MGIAAWIVGDTAGTVQLSTDPFQIDEEGVVPGGIAWKKWQAESPFVHGAHTVHAVKQNSKGVCTIWVIVEQGVSPLVTAAPLVAAFEDIGFAIHQVTNGYEQAWRGELADHEPKINRRYIEGGAVPWTFTFERYPIPVAGVY